MNYSFTIYTFTAYLLGDHFRKDGFEIYGVVVSTPSKLFDFLETELEKRFLSGKQAEGLPFKLKDLKFEALLVGEFTGDRTEFPDYPFLQLTALDHGVWKPQDGRAKNAAH